MNLQKLIPILVYRDISAAHDFLVQVLGFQSGGIVTDPSGSVIHAEVRAGDRAIWLHRVAPEHSMASPTTLPAASTGLFLFVDDVDAHYEVVRSHNAQIDGPPADRPYGFREYGVRDPEGHRWWFASPLAKQAS